MPARPILFHDIADRQHEPRDFCAPDDLVLCRRETPFPFPQGALAYAVDLQAERLIYTLHADPAALFAAPFLYRAQLTDAYAAASVPFEQLDELQAPPARPSLIFSPGRAGSTLLVRLLAACGAPAVSEPDVPAQVARWEREDRRRHTLAMEAALIRASLTALCRAAGPAPFVKLRSQCNLRAAAILGAMPGARPIVLLRRAGAWAASRAALFGEDAAQVASALRHMLDALDALSDTPGLTVLFYEALVSDPAAALTRVLGQAPTREKLAAAMGRDSQAETALARDAERRAPEGFDAAFREAWARAREGAEWSERTKEVEEEVLF